MSGRRWTALGATALLLAALGSAPVSLARFADTDAATAAFGTRRLAAPTNLTATLGANVALGWTASSSGWASGYEVFRSTTSGSGYASVKGVTPVSATATTDSPTTGTWYYVLRTVYGTWSSAASNEASVTIGGVPTSTGFKNCANNASDTGGDGNGYQTSPANGCVQDGAYAQDSNSGNSTSNLCLDPGKDRHRYWGYAFGLPAAVTSIDGITVRARMRTNSTTGTFGACIQLSWDGGASWTAHRPITFSTSAVTTYTFGGATDMWGRTWTAGNLSTSNFRVRIIDVATVTNKRFDLDWLGVSVDYTP
jgi:hypothetical protein